MRRGVTRQGAAGCLVALALACALAAPAEATASSSRCAQSVIEDWAEGRLPGTYPIHCYRDALEGLPEDLRIYSSAGEDIRRALAQRVAASPKTRKQRKLAAADPQTVATSGDGGSFPLPLLVAGSAVLVAGLSSAGFALRRRLRR